jgi:hypothetical protein
MVDSDIHLRPLHTSIVDIDKVFEPLVCCLKGIWVHPYIVTQAKLAPDLGILGHLWRVKMVPLHHSWGWYPHQTTAHIHIRHIQSVWTTGMLSQGYMGASLYHYTGQVGPRFVKSGSLVEGENDAITLWLRLLSTSDHTDLSRVARSEVHYHSCK